MTQRPVTVFFKLGSLGDTIMTTPALRAYRKSFPHDEIIYVIGRTCEAALAGNPNIDRLIVFDDGAFYFGGFFSKLITYFKVIRLLKTLKASKIFILQRDPRWDMAAVKAGIQTRYGFAKAHDTGLTKSFTKSDSTHEVDGYIGICKLADGYKDDGKQMNMYYGDAEPKRIQSLTGKLFEKTVIAIAPGGRSGMKADDDMRRWKGYSELIRLILEKTDYNVLVLGSRSDKTLLDTSIFDKNRVENLCGKIPVGGSFAALKKCALLVANDGGTMIIGAAAEIPVISLFGPSSPADRAPQTNKLSRYIRLNENCGACRHKGWLGIFSRHSCMDNITPDMVLTNIQDILSGAS